MKRSAGVMIVCMAAVVLALAAACGSGSTPDLNGTSWRVVSWSDTSQDPAAFSITADFKDGAVSGMSAVNTYHGPYTVGPGDQFSVGALASTKMAGPEAAMQAESTYLQLLEAAKSCKLEGDKLTLFAADGGASLVYAKK
jgi:heat shock protein HslJ